ncbi:phage tail length tape measure family protein [Ochrobactrum sp. C6C9]|uniref:phage tail length tape measure family protein n=1 Tax=Ochrobactrum sp. C6C9 TaxID=2736662 RepID=UPI00352FFCBA|nr:phage tail length tape measure family protein [Ochrobactrum sp. C6C9]
MADKTDDLIISISTDMATVRRSLKKLEADISNSTSGVVKKFEAMGKGIDNSITTAMQSRINDMVGIGTKASKEWTGALAQQGAELEKLRLRYNPIFAAVKQYQASVVGIQQAHRVGAISSEEMTSAIQRERKATLDSIAAIKQRNSAVSSMKPAAAAGSRGFQTANIAAQFQDIAVTSAMGMSPIQIALQQGTQLSAVFNEMGKGKAVLQGIGAAFASLVSPVSLVTIGVIAASAALFQYITSGKKTADLTEVFKKHAESIALVKEQYGDLGASLLTIRTDDASSQIMALKDQLSSFYAVVGEAASNKASFGAALLTELAPSFREAPEAAKKMRDAFADLNASIRQGKPDILSFREAMSGIANDTTAPKNIQEAAKFMGDMDAEAVKAARSIPSVGAALSLLGGIAADQIGKINAVKNALKELSEIAPPDFSDSERAYQAYSNSIKNDGSIENRIKSADELQKALGRIRASQMPVPGEKPNIESFAPEKTRKSSDERKAERQAERDANAYRDLVKSANDRIEQLKLEERLVGKTGVAAETMRMKLELLQKAQDKGRTVSEAQRAEIDKLATSYGNAAQKVSAMQMVEELQFERAQMFRSPTEQRVASQLRNAGISPDSEYGQAIGNQIRLNEQLAIGRERALDFAQGLANDIMNSADAVDILRNSVSRLAQMLIEMGTNSAINGFFANFGGGLGGGFSANTTLGNFLKGIPGFATGTNSAPGGMAWVGENGPELVNLPRGAQVIPNDILGSIARGGISAPRVPSIPAAANSNGASGVHVTLGWSKDADGNIAPIIRDVSQQTFKQGITAYDRAGAVRTAQNLRQVNARGLVK